MGTFTISYYHSFWTDVTIPAWLMTRVLDEQKLKRLKITSLKLINHAIKFKFRYEKSDRMSGSTFAHHGPKPCLNKQFRSRHLVVKYDGALRQKIDGSIPSAFGAC